MLPLSSTQRPEPKETNRISRTIDSGGPPVLIGDPIRIRIAVQMCSIQFLFLRLVLDAVAELLKHPQVRAPHLALAQLWGRLDTDYMQLLVEPANRTAGFPPGTAGT